MATSTTPSSGRRQPDPKASYQRTATEQNANVSCWVRILLADSDTSQQELARATGINETSLSRSLNDSAERPRGWNIADVSVIAEYFEIHPGILFDEPPNHQSPLDTKEVGPTPNRPLRQGSTLPVTWGRLVALGQEQSLLLLLVRQDDEADGWAGLLGLMGRRYVIEDLVHHLGEVFTN